MLQKTKEYINAHEAVMMRIKKPLVAEEFGLPRDGFSFALSSTVHYRNKYYESVMQELMKSKKGNSSMAGINFWAFGGLGRPAKNGATFFAAPVDFILRRRTADASSNY